MPREDFLYSFKGSTFRRLQHAAATVNPAAMPPFDRALWNWSEDRPLTLEAAAASVIATTRRSQRPQLTVETIFTDSSTPLEMIHPSGRVEFDTINRSGVTVLRLAEDSGNWAVAFFPTQYEGIYQLAGGLPSTHGNWRRLARWLSASGNASRCYLNHGDFAAIGSSLAEFGNVEVIRMSGRVTQDDSSINRGFPVAGGPRPTPAQAIDEMESAGAAIRTVTVAVEGVLHSHIRRMAGATYYSGQMRVFADTVLTHLERAASARRELLAGRARRGLDQVRPVAVYLRGPLFNTTADSAQVLEALRSLSKFDTAVVHGNPYLHVTVLDQADGSNCDVVVSEPTSIHVYPGFRASGPSLERLSHALAQRFGADSIEELRIAPAVALAEIAN